MRENSTQVIKKSFDKVYQRCSINIVLTAFTLDFLRSIGQVYYIMTGKHFGFVGFCAAGKTQGLRTSRAKKHLRGNLSKSVVYKALIIQYYIYMYIIISK